METTMADDTMNQEMLAELRGVTTGTSRLERGRRTRYARTGRTIDPWVATMGDHYSERSRDAKAAGNYAEALDYAEAARGVWTGELDLVCAAVARVTPDDMKQRLWERSIAKRDAEHLRRQEIGWRVPLAMAGTYRLDEFPAMNASLLVKRRFHDRVLHDAKKAGLKLDSQGHLPASE
jgi:hypothetical protein